MSIVKWNLKEAGGKISALRTETDYEVTSGGQVCKTKSYNYPNPDVVESEGA